MNKLFTFLASAALVGSFTACSSDEPAKGTDQGNPEAKSSMYLAVKISSADRAGRAGSNFEDNQNPIEGSYKVGTEHEVAAANFYFFNSEGIYVAQGQKWNGGSAITSPEDNNIEFESNTIIALKGLKSDNLPKYVITVLNAPTFAEKMLLNVSTMADFQKEELNYLATITEEDNSKKDYFVMTTSSFYINDASSILYDDEKPYANRIPAGYLEEEPIDLSKAKTLDIYVERLAAKYSLDAAKKTFEVSLTLAGSDNDGGVENTPSTGAAATTLEVTITGLGVTNTEPTSYLLKDISGFAATGIAPSWNDWNNPTDHRSFWGKSVGYNSTDVTNFTAAKFADGVHTDVTTPAYSNETTKLLANIQGTNNALKANLLPVFYLTAETKVKGSAENLVEYDGVFFLENQFKKFHLSRLANSTTGLNYWKRVKQTTETTPTEIGNIVANGYEYTQVGPDDLSFVRKDETVKNSTVKLVYTAGVTLYEYDENAAEGSKFQPIPDFESKLNTYLESLFSNTDNYPEYYNGGKMYYTIPVEHLLGTNKSAPNITAEKEGEYGTVRNHWYQLSVNKIAKMGHGVFDPSNGEDGDIIYPDPDPNTKTYGMAAQIKILSWKIVKQTVDL